MQKAHGVLALCNSVSEAGVHKIFACTKSNNKNSIRPGDELGNKKKQDEIRQVVECRFFCRIITYLIQTLVLCSVEKWPRMPSDMCKLRPLNSFPSLLYGSRLRLRSSSKCQLISKGLFGVSVLTKKPTIFFKDFCPSLKKEFT